MIQEIVYLYALTTFFVANFLFEPFATLKHEIHGFGFILNGFGPVLGQTREFS